jgi:hypothetical protein
MGSCSGRAQILVDGTHIVHLERPTKLDAQKPEAHVPDLPEAKSGLFHPECQALRYQNFMAFKGRSGTAALSSWPCGNPTFHNAGLTWPPFFL